MPTPPGIGRGEVGKEGASSGDATSRMNASDRWQPACYPGRAASPIVVASREIFPLAAKHVEGMPVTVSRTGVQFPPPPLNVSDNGAQNQDTVVINRIDELPEPVQFFIREVFKKQYVPVVAIF